MLLPPHAMSSLAALQKGNAPLLCKWSRNSLARLASFWICFLWKASRIAVVPDTEPVQWSARLVKTLKNPPKEPKHCKPSASVSAFFCRSGRLSGAYLWSRVGLFPRSVVGVRKAWFGYVLKLHRIAEDGRGLACVLCFAAVACALRWPAAVAIVDWQNHLALFVSQFLT